MYVIRILTWMLIWCRCFEKIYTLCIMFCNALVNYMTGMLLLSIKLDIVKIRKLISFPSNFFTRLNKINFSQSEKWTWINYPWVWDVYSRVAYMWTSIIYATKRIHIFNFMPRVSVYTLSLFIVRLHSALYYGKKRFELVICMRVISMTTSIFGVRVV